MNFKELLTSNLLIKLLSLLFAALLCFFVILEADDNIEIPLSVKYLNLPVGLKVKNPQDSHLMVRIEGPRILLMRQKLLGTHVQLDLSEAKEGVTVYSGLERFVHLIDGVKPLELSPSGLALTLQSQNK